jgi:4-oxalocrotonate tautomerase
MPLVHVKVFEGELSETLSQDMIVKVTDAVVSVAGEGLRPYTWVLIEEVKSGNWGIGGKAVTLADAKAIAAGQA